MSRRKSRNKRETNYMQLVSGETAMAGVVGFIFLTVFMSFLVLQADAGNLWAAGVLAILTLGIFIGFIFGCVAVLFRIWQGGSLEAGVQARQMFETNMAENEQLVAAGRQAAPEEEQSYIRADQAQWEGFDGDG